MRVVFTLYVLMIVAGLTAGLIVGLLGH